MLCFFSQQSKIFNKRYLSSDTMGVLKNTMGVLENNTGVLKIPGGGIFISDISA